MSKYLAIAIIGFALTGCSTMTDILGNNALGVIDTIVEKGAGAGDKVRQTAQDGAHKACNLLRDRPEEHQAIRDWVWTDPETGGQVGDRVHLYCKDGLE